jgi:hypothetical protein
LSVIETLRREDCPLNEWEKLLRPLTVALGCRLAGLAMNGKGTPKKAVRFPLGAIFAIFAKRKEAGLHPDQQLPQMVSVTLQRLRVPGRAAVPPTD